MIHSHFDSVLKNFDIIKIKKKKFTVLLDAVNGAGSIVVSDFLKFLGCKVVEINCIPNGKFPRPPEPTPTALQKTSAIMKKSGADIGFALDPDADRLVVLTPKRGSISEEYTLPLSLLSAVKKYKGNSIVINLSTSFINDQILLPFRKRVLRAKVGEANVVQMMLEDNSFFGGEGNGGVIDPKVTSFGRDSLTGIAHILNLLTEEKKSIDEIVNRLPEIHLDKTAIPIKPEISKEKIFENAIKTFPEAKVDSRDGLRLDLGNAWVHLRASNTEPIIRIICEAKSKEDLKALLKKTTQLVGS
jgi:phosphomannomutase